MDLGLEHFFFINDSQQEYIKINGIIKCFSTLTFVLLTQSTTIDEIWLTSEFNKIVSGRQVDILITIFIILI